MLENDKTLDRAVQLLRRIGMDAAASLILTRDDPKERRRSILHAMSLVRLRLLINPGFSRELAQTVIEALTDTLWLVPVLRVRKAKVVRIPDEWVGRFTTDKTKRGRRERAIEKRKARRKRLRTDADFHMLGQEP